MTSASTAGRPNSQSKGPASTLGDAFFRRQYCYPLAAPTHPLSTAPPGAFRVKEKERERERGTGKNESGKGYGTRGVKKEVLLLKTKKIIMGTRMKGGAPRTRDDEGAAGSRPRRGGRV